MSASDPVALRAQAQRLADQAAEAEAKAVQHQRMLDALSPFQRCAITLHDHFARTYPGSGGLMDGGDPWFYEGVMRDGRMVSHDWHGAEHRKFVGIADSLAVELAVEPERLEEIVTSIADHLNGYTLPAVRERQERQADAKLARARDGAVESVFAAFEAAGVPRPATGIGVRA